MRLWRNLLVKTTVYKVSLKVSTTTIVLGADARWFINQITCGQCSHSGEQTSLSIRPERILPRPPASIAITWYGQVKEFIYLGDHIRLCIDTCGSSNFIVEDASEPVRSKHQTGRQTGDRVAKRIMSAPSTCWINNVSI